MNVAIKCTQCRDRSSETHRVTELADYCYIYLHIYIWDKVEESQKDLLIQKE